MNPTCLHKSPCQVPAKQRDGKILARKCQGIDKSGNVHRKYNLHKTWSQTQARTGSPKLLKKTLTNVFFNI